MKSTHPRAFSVSLYVTDILKMCMSKFNDEKIIFVKFTPFLTFLDHCTYYVMDDSAYFVKSTPPRVFSVSFYYFACTLQIYLRCACGSLMMKFNY